MSGTAASAQQAADAAQEVQLEELAVAGDGRGAGVGAGSGAGVPRLKADGYLARDSVSATRTQTPLREVPQTVVVVPAQTLTDAAATRIDSALDLAGVGRANNFGGLGLSEFTIRGLATGEYYRNGFPINRGYANSPDIVSIERVEVLKGPSAFLYGRGDPGGTFNIVTKQPLPERSLTVGQQIGSFNSKRTTFDASTGALDANGQVFARITAPSRTMAASATSYPATATTSPPSSPGNPAPTPRSPWRASSSAPPSPSIGASCRSTATSGCCRATASSASRPSGRITTTTPSANCASSTRSTRTGSSPPGRSSSAATSAATPSGRSVGS